MIIFKSKEQAINLRNKAIEMLEVGSIAFGSDKYRNDSYVDVSKWETALEEANNFLIDLGKKEIDKILNNQ